MKRPEGFDERPARPVAPVEDDRAPRERPAPRLPRLPFRRGAGTDDGREARVDPDVPAAAPETVAPGPSRPAGALPELPDVGATGPVRTDDGPGADHDAAATDVVDLLTASRPTGSTEATDGHEAPIGAGVRAAETARDARVARKRRKLLERAEVRRFTRRSRHRRAAWVTAGGVVVVLGVSILVAVYSPLMALRTIEIKGTSRVDDAALRHALSEQIGTPLARLDFGAIKKDIAGFPLIESYVTEEEPPNTLVVTVTERTPVVAVKTGKTFDLVDAAGIVVQSAPKQPDTMPLADIGSVKLGSSVFRTMTEVVLALPSTVRAQVSGVSASTADDVTLAMKDGSRVVWGSPDDSDAKAALLDALVKDHASRDPKTAVEYDVSAPDNGIIRAQS